MQRTIRWPRGPKLLLPAALMLLVLSTPFSMTVGAPPPGSPSGGCATPYAGHTLEPDAGTWATWFVAPADVSVPSPPGHQTTQSELQELRDIQQERTQADIDAAQAWTEVAAGVPWSSRYLELVVASTGDPYGNPPRIAREIAILETALFDAFAAAWDAKYCFHRKAPSVVSGSISPAGEVLPLPSYPSEVAVAAGVASILLPEFFPTLDAAALTAETLDARDAPLVLGLNYRSDVTAGYALGQQVAESALAARAGDGSDAVWDGSGQLTGPCNWQPSPPGFRPPLEPVWGEVTPFLMTDGSQFRAPPPPACDGDDYLAQYRDIFETSLTLNDRQKEIADYWEAGPGTVTPPGMNLEVAIGKILQHDLTTMRAQRVLAHQGAAIADAGIASWDTKFHYWWDRPVTAIRRLGWDPDWLSHSGTPPFPGYVSGHSTFTGAGQEVLKFFFPESLAECRAYQTEAAMARYYGGIHFRADNEEGIVMGMSIGQLAIQRAINDGAA